jgi:serine/threonine protein phosphatase PrpC
MQGWRKTMEDAHITATAISSCEDACLFAVFDGHGGSEVAKFCAKHMRAELESLGSFRAGDYDSALTEVFHRMDTMLLDEAHAPELAAVRELNARVRQSSSSACCSPLTSTWHSILSLSSAIMCTASACFWLCSFPYFFAVFPVATNTAKHF